MERSAPVRPEAGRRAIEHWFVRRGVPQLIEGYSTEPAMDARAAPVISLWLVAGSILFWGTRPDWPALWNVLGVAATLAWMGFFWVTVCRIRGRSSVVRPTTFDVLDVVAIGLSPALPAGLLHGNPWEAVTAALGALAGIGVIYLLIGFGLFEIGAWAAERLWVQLAGIVQLMTSTLPLLLILVAFLLFAAEIWEAAHAMSGIELGAVLLLLLAIAGLLVVTTFRREFPRLVSSLDAATIRATVKASTAARLLPTPPPEAVVHHVRLSGLQRTNLALLVVFQQLLQAVFVSLIVMAFLVILGSIAIPGTVQEGWIGAPVVVLATGDVLGEVRIISAELITVSALLGGIVGLYFSGLALSDPTYRAAQFDRAMHDVRELLAVRAVYLAGIRPKVTALNEAATVPEGRAATDEATPAPATGAGGLTRGSP